jgi:hypothetical protein
MNSGHWQPSTKAIKVLRKLITVIKNEPLRFDMAFWVAYNHMRDHSPSLQNYSLSSRLGIDY